MIHVSESNYFKPIKASNKVLVFLTKPCYWKLSIPCFFKSTFCCKVILSLQNMLYTDRHTATSSGQIHHSFGDVCTSPWRLPVCQVCYQDAISMRAQQELAAGASEYRSQSLFALLCICTHYGEKFGHLRCQLLKGNSVDKREKGAFYGRMGSFKTPVTHF